MISLTVALTTLRKEPRFELLVESLIIAAAKYPMLTWEFLCIDGIIWYDPNRRQKLADAVKGRFKYIHEPPKPTLWQGPTRLTSKDYWDACSARNTAYLYANGRQVIFVDDCISIPEDFLYHHFGGVMGNCAVAGGYRIEGTDGNNDHRLAAVTEPQFVSGGWLYGMNMSVPLVAAYKVNGYDEMYSGQGGVEDCEHGVRLERAGCKLLFNPDCVVTEHADTHEAICGHQKGPLIPPKSRMLRDDKMHYANEFLVQKLFDEPERFLPLGNRFNLTELRKLVQAGKPLPVPTWPLRDWRDGAFLKDC